MKSRPCFESKGLFVTRFTAPASESAGVEGVGTLVIDPFAETIPEIDGVPYTVIITSRDTLKNKPELLRAAVRALTKAMKFAHEKPDAAR